MMSSLERDQPSDERLAAAYLAIASRRADAIAQGAGHRMSGRRVDTEASTALVAQLPTLPITGAIAPSTVDLDGEPRDRLPSDHPAWMRDAISLSRRARDVVGRIKPLAIRVLSMWDHRVRSITVGGRRLSIDLSGSYRLD